MAMAASSAVLPVTGGSHLESYRLPPSMLRMLGGHQSQIVFPRRKMSQLNRCRHLTVCAEYKDGSRDGSVDFLAGFVIGGALFGTLAYVFAPQIRRSLLNENESGFQSAKRPIYYDEGLEKTRRTLNAKIGQMNAAIDNVSSRLRGGHKSKPEHIEADSEIEATM